MKPVPPLFRLIDEYDIGTSDTRQITEYIVEHPEDLYTIFAGMPVFAYAACTSLECLQAIHDAYSQAKENGFQPDDVQPYDLRGDGGYTPLHSTLAYSLTQEASYLIDNVKVDVNITDENKNTPLHLACLVKNRHIIRNLVISGGAKVNVLNNQSKTPLHMCVLSNDVESCGFLLSKGAKTIVKKGRFMIDVMYDVKQIGSTEMKMFFAKYHRQQRHKNAASKRLSHKRRNLLRLSNEYDFLCSQLQDESNKYLVAYLASKLRLNNDNIEHKKKKDLCDAILTKLGVLSITPNLA